MINKNPKKAAHVSRFKGVQGGYRVVSVTCSGDVILCIIFVLLMSSELGPLSVSSCPCPPVSV